MIEKVYLANGESVPQYCVDALHEFEKIWPGATFIGARAAIVAEVLKAVYFERETRCPTCQGRVWNVKLGKWIYSRHTVDMVCPECGRDYMKIEE